MFMYIIYIFDPKVYNNCVIIMHTIGLINRLISSSHVGIYNIYTYCTYMHTAYFSTVGRIKYDILRYKPYRYYSSKGVIEMHYVLM